MSMSQRIKEQRMLRDWTQQQLAEKLDVSVDTVKSLEIGRARPSLETLTKLCDLFECTADYLMGRTDEPDTKFLPLTFEELEYHIEKLKSMKHTLDEQSKREIEAVTDELQLLLEKAKDSS